MNNDVFTRKYMAISSQLESQNEEFHNKYENDENWSLSFIHYIERDELEKFDENCDMKYRRQWFSLLHKEEIILRTIKS